jgi:hypothetical protein
MAKKKPAKKTPAKPVKKVTVKKAPAKSVKKAPPAKAAPKAPAAKPAKAAPAPKSEKAKPTIEVIKPADSHIYQGMEGIVTKAHKAAVNALLSTLYLFLPKLTKDKTEIKLYGRRLELLRVKPDKTTEPMVAYVIDEIAYFTPSSDEPDPSTGLRPGTGGLRCRKNAEDLGVLTAAEEFLTVYGGTTEGRSAALNKLTQLIKPKMVTVESGTTRPLVHFEVGEAIYLRDCMLQSGPDKSTLGQGIFKRLEDLIKSQAGGTTELPNSTKRKPSPAAPLKEALQQIIAARDHNADAGEYPEDLGIGDDRAFDDWAADLAQEAIDRSLELADPITSTEESAEQG